MQGILLPDWQTLTGDSRHEDKHYKIGNHGAQTSSVGARGHYSSRFKTSNNEKKKRKKGWFVCDFR